MAATYTAKDILVLEGLEPVRRRPGMYIGGVDAAGLHHLLWEIVDNSVDEAMNGYADRIRVRYTAAPEVEAAIAAFRDWISGETLATAWSAGDGAADLKSAPVDDLPFAFALDRA